MGKDVYHSSQTRLLSSAFAAWIILVDFFFFCSLDNTLREIEDKDSGLKLLG
jgi:hypothetical protein